MRRAILTLSLAATLATGSLLVFDGVSSRERPSERLSPHLLKDHQSSPEAEPVRSQTVGSLVPVHTAVAVATAPVRSELVVRGRVVGPDGEPVPGARVTLGDRTCLSESRPSLEGLELTRLLDGIPLERRVDAYQGITWSSSPYRLFDHDDGIWFDFIVAAEGTTNSDGTFALGPIPIGHDYSGTLYAGSAGEPPLVGDTSLRLAHSPPDTVHVTGALTTLDRIEVHVKAVRTLSVLVDTADSPLCGARVEVLHRARHFYCGVGMSDETPWDHWDVKPEPSFRASSGPTPDLRSVRITDPGGRVLEPLLHENDSVWLDVTISAPGYAREQRELGEGQVDLALALQAYERQRKGLAAEDERPRSDVPLPLVEPILRVSLVRAALTPVRVLTPDGSPVANARVTAYDAQHRRVETALTDMNGALVFRELAAGRPYTFVVRAAEPWYLDAVLEGRPPTPLEVTLSPAAALTVSFTIPFDHPESPFSSRLELTLTRTDGRTVARASIRTDFTKPIPVAPFERLEPGRYRVTLSGGGVASAASPVLDLAPSVPRTFSFEPRAGRKLHVRVVDERGAPLRRADVCGADKSGWTSADGDADLTDLPWDSFELVVKAEGHATARVAVGASVESIADVVLSRVEAESPR